MNPAPTAPDRITQELLHTCRLLTDHLSAYAVSATNFDEEAFIACEQAERLLYDAKFPSIPSRLPSHVER
jgi:hypothetical protein